MISWSPKNDLTDSSLPQYFRSLALIPDSTEPNSRWLCLWDSNRNCFNFISAERRKQESFRTCIHAAVLDNLRLTKRDVLVSNMAQLNLEFVATLPGDTSESHIAVSFYAVHLYSRSSRHAVTELVEGRWLTGKELMRGQTSDGWRVDPTLNFLLRRADIIPTW